MSRSIATSANGLTSTEPVKKPRRVTFRLGVRGILVVVACCAVLLWAARKISDNLSPVRVAARHVEYGMDLDRQDVIETLTQASGNEIDVALPALIKLQDRAGPDDRGRILAGMTSLLIERLMPWTRGSPPLPETAAWQARSVIDALCAGLKSPDDTTRIQAAQSLRMALKPELALTVIVPGGGRAGLVETEALLRALEPAMADPLAEVRMEAAQALGNVAVALDREPPPALRSALRDPSTMVRNAAAEAVAGFRKGLDPCLTDLFQIMAENRLEVVESLRSVRSRCSAAIIHGVARPTAGAIPVLTNALKSSQSEIRGAAASLLGRIGPDAALAVPALVAALKQSLNPAPGGNSVRLDPWEPREIVGAVQKIDPQGPTILREIVPVLVSAIALHHPLTGESAVEALVRLGPVAEPAVPALIEVMNQRTEQMTQEVAAGALVQIARGTPSAGRARAALEDAFKKGLISRDLARQLDAGTGPAGPHPAVQVPLPPREDSNAAIVRE